MRPTPEQTLCVDHFGTGRKLRINAYAGTGKTSTLKMLARSTGKRGLYLAFNSAVAKQSQQEFPRNVSCSTVHSLAYRAMKHRFGSDKMTGKISAGYLASKLGLRSFTLCDGTEVSSRGFGFLIGKTVQQWQRSGNGQVMARHVPMEGALAKLDDAPAKELENAVVRQARLLWSRMADRNDEIPMGHDGYLKLWALDQPTLAADFVLLDEAQDTNGVVLALMQHQPGQIIAVGDRHQQIYEWRGARNAMVELPAELEARLSTSFRFGPAIAENASAVLRLLGETVPLKGNPERASTVGAIDRPRAILTRTNATLIGEVVRALETEQRPCIVGGVDEVLMYVDAAEKLMNGQKVDMPLDFFGFANWREVCQASEQDDGADLRRWVNLFDAHGTGPLRTMLSQLPTREAEADFVLSTGHKSKGREWETVMLADDFLRGVGENKNGKQMRRAEDCAEELRLFYVAVTRGRDAVEIPSTLTEKLALIEAAPALPAELAPAIATTPTVAPPPASDEFEVIDVAPPANEEFERVDLDLMLPPAYALAGLPPLPTPVEPKPAKTYPPRMIKCECSACGYTVRTTRKWLKFGAPICPVDNSALAVAGEAGGVVADAGRA